MRCWSSKLHLIRFDKGRGPGMGKREVRCDGWINVMMHADTQKGTISIGRVYLT